VRAQDGNALTQETGIFPVTSNPSYAIAKDEMKKMNLKLDSEVPGYKLCLRLQTFTWRVKAMVAQMDIFSHRATILTKVFE